MDPVGLIVTAPKFQGLRFLDSFEAPMSRNVERTGHLGSNVQPHA